MTETIKRLEEFPESGSTYLEAAPVLKNAYSCNQVL